MLCEGHSRHGDVSMLCSQTLHVWKRCIRRSATGQTVCVRPLGNWWHAMPIHDHFV